MNRCLPAVTVALICLVLPCFGSAQARTFFDEVRFGAYQHDTGLIGTQKEEGADFALELLSRPVTALSLIGSPRIVFGGALNTAGQTSQIYLGVDKQLDFARSVFGKNDAFFVEGTFGGDWQNGKLDVRNTPAEARWKSHGSAFLFRSGLALGYQFNETWSMAVNFNHISNANLATPNEGMNDLGLLIGMKL